MKKVTHFIPNDSNIKVKSNVGVLLLGGLRFRFNALENITIRTQQFNTGIDYILGKTRPKTY